MVDSCYVIAFYLGGRRRKFPKYEEDRLIYLKEQIFKLNEVKHSLSKIYFVFSVEKDHYDLLNEALKLIPKEIQGAKTEVVIRKNEGFSYGAWDKVMKNLKHDYYIFNEDDYFFIEDNWDTYMINSFREKPNCGGFGVWVKPQVNGLGEHFSHSCFCTSKEVIQDIQINYGGFPYHKDLTYKAGEDTQIRFSNILIKAGYRLYDAREDYRLDFAMTADPDDQPIPEGKFWIWRLFEWNQKPLMVPDIKVWEYPYNWWLGWDGWVKKESRCRDEFPHPNPEIRKNDT